VVAQRDVQKAPCAGCPLDFLVVDTQASYEKAKAGGVKILVEPFDGPFGRTFSMADPDGYAITIYERDQPLFWPPK
jgi:predicted enzyme related to lactoylglutathione lyase